MKRARNLIPQIAEWGNLHLAYTKAKKGKSTQYRVLEFAENLEENLQILRQELLDGAVSVGRYHYFKVYDPKERLICASAFRERVLQHAIINICHDHFEQYQIVDSYACRLGKGTYAALDRARFFSKKQPYYAKLDVRKYFETIDHALLLRLLHRRFKDPRLLMVFSTIIDSYETERGKGLPIGNLTSQYFANHLLAVADHFVKEQLQQKAYVRYMDDMVLWSDSYESLHRQVNAFQSFLEQGLHCEMKPVEMNSVERGLPFLGYVVTPQHLRMSKRSKNRFKRKFHAYHWAFKYGHMGEEEYQQRVEALFSFALHANSFSFRKSVLLKVGAG